MAQGRIFPPELWTAEAIINLIKEGNLPPWAKSWSMSPEMQPRNLCNQKIPYRGLNYMLLSMVSGMMGSPFFITPRQLFEKGGKKKDEDQKTWPVFFFMTKENDKDGTKSFICKGYKVYNVTQTVGIEDKIPAIPEPERFDHSPIEACESIISRYTVKPEIEIIGQQPAYSPSEDKIRMPEANRFHIPEEYYSTLFHELVHSTGHRDRLNRVAIHTSSFMSHAYSAEELVAEFGSAMLCGRAGISNKTIENSASYIKYWARSLKPDMLVHASRAAKKAYELIIGKEDTKESEPED